MDALAELLSPTIGRRLMERHLSAWSGTIGLLRKRDLRGLSPREVIRPFLKLERIDEECQRRRVNVLSVDVSIMKETRSGRVVGVYETTQHII